MVEENARKSERDNAHRARFRLVSDATAGDRGRRRSGETGATDRRFLNYPFLHSFYMER